MKKLLLLLSALLLCGLNRPSHATPPFSIALQSVEFVGDHTVYHDIGTQGAYPNPHYKVTVGTVATPGTNAVDSEIVNQSPVCYKRGQTLSIKATFVVANQPANTTLYVKGRGWGYGCGTFDFNKKTLAGGIYSGTGERGKPGTTTDEKISTWPNRVFKGGFIIDWDYWLQSTQTPTTTENWRDVGLVRGNGVETVTRRSENQLYLTLDTPTPSKLFHTLLDLSCHNLNSNPEDTLGMNEEVYKDKVVEAIWAEFADRNVTRTEAGPDPANPYPMLTYWSPTGQSVSAEITAELLRDGRGQCGSWASFLKDCFAVHQLGAIKMYLTPQYQNNTGSVPEKRGLMLVKRWTARTPNPPARMRDAVYGEYFDYTPADTLDDRSGLQAQGQYTPLTEKKVFTNHFIVRCRDNYYDPSYGGGPYGVANTDAGKAKWEDASIDAFGKPFTYTIVGNDGRRETKVNYFYKPNTPGADYVEVTFAPFAGD